jgi:Ca2+-binding EF-hand superfamily protein
MFTKLQSTWILLAIAALFAAAAYTRQNRTPDSPTPDKISLGTDQVKQLLLLMDTDRNGKISRQEYMHFMEAEFNRLDKDKNGELDPKELMKSQLQLSSAYTFSRAGK